MDIVKKKRGRKPKNFFNKNSKLDIINENINTEDEQIILHLQITVDEINTNNSNNFNDNNDNNTEYIDDLFLKNTTNNNNNKNESNTMSSDINSTIGFNNINKIITYSLNLTNATKCWWCKNSFDTPAIQMPENYYNDTFYCIGNFCSYNCVKSYNLDINDLLIYKRESLINLLYYLTYSEYINIEHAPHWLTLEEFGGPLTIDKFRENNVTNKKEYLLLHPPLISRQMQIEESYKINKTKEVNINKINKIYSEIDSDYIIKRNKSLSMNQLNLESTMGLIKKKYIK